MLDRFRGAGWLALAALAPASSASPPATPEAHFIVGPRNTEDLVASADGHWIIGSGRTNLRFGAGAQMVLIDARAKTWTNLYPGLQPRARSDRARFPDCPAPPAGGLDSHGLSLREGQDKRATLFVINHSGRESVEIFEVDFRGPVPGIVWIGCVIEPDSARGNAVAGLRDGGFVMTSLLNKGRTQEQIFRSEPTGDVWEWEPRSGWRRVPGGSLPGDNGIEVSPDEQWIYVATSGRPSVVRLARKGDNESPATIAGLTFQPDNLRWSPDGSLLVAGQNDEVACGGPIGFRNGLLDFKCERGARVDALDPATMTMHTLVAAPARPDFYRVSSALRVGHTLWVSSYDSDRIEYFDRP